MQSLVAEMLRAMGRKILISGCSPALERTSWHRGTVSGSRTQGAAEVKHRVGQVGAPGIQSFVGSRHVDDKRLYSKHGRGFSKEAGHEAGRANVLVTLLDFHELAETLAENYEALDGETRRLVPLRRIYWPAR